MGFQTPHVGDSSKQKQQERVHQRSGNCRGKFVEQLQGMGPSTLGDGWLQSGAGMLRGSRGCQVRKRWGGLEKLSEVLLYYFCLHEVVAEVIGMQVGPL